MSNWVHQQKNKSNFLCKYEIFLKLKFLCSLMTSRWLAMLHFSHCQAKKKYATRELRKNDEKKVINYSHQIWIKRWLRMAVISRNKSWNVILRRLSSAIQEVVCEGCHAKTLWKLSRWEREAKRRRATRKKRATFVAGESDQKRRRLHEWDARAWFMQKERDD